MVVAKVPTLLRHEITVETSTVDGPTVTLRCGIPTDGPNRIIFKLSTEQAEALEHALRIARQRAKSR